eukprot:TRINITY_DN6102_c0_g1_i5.p1 TRINITY_DN6102_c0_g1~~TRINITY_DN6102_c0_g1_i5.p1  ORF type:complete len:666 (-),score=100.49 TRINITY_DN6102_c0_g1_i5:195-2192(-)
MHTSREGMHMLLMEEVMTKLLIMMNMMTASMTLVIRGMISAATRTILPRFRDAQKRYTTSMHTSPEGMIAAATRAGVVDGRGNDEHDDSINDAGHSRDDSSSGADDAPSLPRRPETIYDFDAYFARRQAGVVDGRGNDEHDDSINDAGHSRDDSSSGADDAPSLPRRPETIYYLDAYFARGQAGVADGRGNDEHDDSINDAGHSRDDSSSDEDDAPSFPRRSETIYDFDAYFARRQAGVVDGRGNDEHDDSINDAGHSRDDSSSGADDAPSLPRRPETIYDFDAYFARGQAGVADGRGNDEHDDSINDAGHSRDDSSSGADDAPSLPRRPETIYYLDAYFARGQAGVADGRGNDEHDDSINDAGHSRDDSSSDEDDAPSFPRRSETIYDFDAYFARRQAGVVDGRGNDDRNDSIGDAAGRRNGGRGDEDGVTLFPRRSDGSGDNQGDDHIPNGSRRNSSSDEDEACSTPFRTGTGTAAEMHALLDTGPPFRTGTGTAAEMHAMVDTGQVHFVQSNGGGEGQGAMRAALRRPFSTSFLSNDAVSARASSSHRQARSSSFDDAADLGTHRQSWTAGSSRQAVSFGEDRSSRSAGAHECAIAGAQAVCEQATSEAAALAGSVQVDMVGEGLSDRVADDIGGAQRESIIAMARARRRPFEHGTGFGPTV